MFIKQHIRPVKARSPVYQSRDFKNFRGGWNVIDNELNLSVEYSAVMENVLRRPDGSIGVRFGFRMVADIANQETTSGTLGAQPFYTTGGSSVVRVSHPNHGLLSGHKITFVNATDQAGVSASEYNGEKEVTYVDDDAYEFVITSAAAGTGFGNGANIVFSHNNKMPTPGSYAIWSRYFQDHAIVAMSSGEIVAVNANGVSKVIWNSAIASKQPGAPTGWSTGLTFADMDSFGNQLIITNGVDKPLIVDFRTQPVCKYLQDVATGSNINTPITKYVRAMPRYCVLAGDPEEPDAVHVSNIDTSGTYEGDPPPNDAVKFYASKRAQSNSDTIRGLGRFRNSLVVAFDDALAVGSLGTYNNDVHVPDFSDPLEGMGCLTHHAMVAVGDDMYMCDHIGIPSLRRATLNDSIVPDRVSQLIDPEIQKALGSLSVITTSERVFALTNPREGQFLLFVPNHDEYAQTTETVVYVYTYIKALGVKAWSRFRGWNFRCGYVSALGRLFFWQGTKMYVYGSTDDPIYADFVGDPAVADPAKGNPIEFDWELPWTDFGSRERLKASKYLRLDTLGDGDFTVSMFVDDLYLDENDDYTPAISLDFVGGSIRGYGDGDQPYGAGRITSDRRLYAWPSTFKTMKMRFHGETTREVKFVSFTIGYQLGSIRG